MSIVLNLQRSAQLWPERPALTDKTTISFAELSRRVRGIAVWLRRQGLRRGDRAALILDNSIDYVVAYYGVIAAGGIAVALNTAAKSRDLAAWIDHCAAGWLFARAADVEVGKVRGLLATGVHFIDVDDGGMRRVEVDAEVPFDDLPADPDQPAAIIYTSGTTGSPKGVLLSHRNLASNAAAIAQYLGLSERDCIVNVLPFHYSYGSSVLHSHIAVGGHIVLADGLVFPHLVVEALARWRATGFAGVPSTFLLLLSRGRIEQYDLSALRYVTQAGGPMPAAVVERVREALPGAKVFVMYGQTEATARISWLPPERVADKPGSVGIAIPGTTLRVVGEDDAPLAPGVVGEVCVRGPNVMMGYWDNPGATAVALRNGWLHTGDFGHLDEDGFLYLAGRRSDMIKTGAHRVHPQDVEAVIMEMEGIADVAVVGAEDEVLGECVKAYVVADGAASPDPQRIRFHCRARLAHYKVPKIIEYCQSLPRTASGKIQRHLLQQRKKAP